MLVSQLLSRLNVPHIAVGTSVVPGVPFDKADVSSLTVGFEFEFCSPKSHKAFATAFSKRFPNFPVGEVTPKHNTQKEKGYTAWHITGDPSIKATKFGIELISPVLRLSDVLPTLSDLFSFLRDMKCSTNESTGLHVTFGHKKLTPDFKYFDPLKFGVFMREDKLLARFGRSQNGFTSNLSNLIGSVLKAELTGTEQGAPVYHTHRSNVFYNKGAVPDGEKPLQRDNLRKILTSPAFRQRVMPKIHYSSVSLTKLGSNLVEVRSIGGDWLNHSPKDIAMLVQHIARSLILSISPKTGVDQYVLAVTRLLNTVDEYGKEKPSRAVSINKQVCFFETPTEYTSDILVHKLQDNETRITYRISSETRSGVSILLIGSLLRLYFTFQTSDSAEDLIRLLDLLVTSYINGDKLPLLTKSCGSKSNYKEFVANYPELVQPLSNYSIYLHDLHHDIELYSYKLPSDAAAKLRDLLERLEEHVRRS